MELTLNARPLSPLAGEASLVDAARHGDDRAFEQLYARYRDRIHAFIVSKVRDHGRAEDIGQEVFMSALRQLRATDQTIVFKPWLYTIAKNACIDEFRRGSRAREVSIDADEELGGGVSERLVSSMPTPVTAIESKQSLDDLRGAFSGLSDSQHQLLVMRELEGLSYHEIGERLGMTKQMVESGLFRARRKLTEEYDELASGRRCGQIQSAIDAGTLLTVRGMGIKDRRRYSRHLSHCQLCRHQALMAGVDESLLKRSLAAKVAALLPFPLLRKLWPFSHGGGAASAAGGAGGTGGAAAAGGTAAAGAAGGVGPAAAIAALALAGAGGGFAIAEHTGSHHRAATPAPVVHQHAPATPAVAPAVHPRPAHMPATPRHVRADRTGRHDAAPTKPHARAHASVKAPASRVSTSPAVAASQPATTAKGASADPIAKTRTHSHLPVASAPTSTTPTRTTPTGTTPTRTSSGPDPSTPRSTAPTTTTPVGTAPVKTLPPVTDPVTTVVNTTGGAVDAVGTTAGTVVDTVGTTAGTTVAGAGKAVGTTVAGVGGTLGGTVGGVATGVGKTVGSVGAGTPVAPVTGAVGGALSGIGQGAGATVTGATGAVGGVATGATSAAGSTVAATTGAAGKTVDTVTGGLSGLLGGPH